MCGWSETFLFAFFPQAALLVPTEDGMEAYVTTQGSDIIQTGIAGVLGKPQN